MTVIKIKIQYSLDKASNDAYQKSGDIEMKVDDAVAQYLKSP